MFRPEDQRPMTSQFAVRVAVLSGIALVAFAVIFFRLWYLEVLSGEEYLKQAQNNRVRELTIQAARGKILDSNGKALVRNRTALSLQVRPDKLPELAPEKNAELEDLAKVSGLPLQKIKREIRRQTKELPASPVTLQQDAERDLIFFLRERGDQFPGISIEEVYVRDYPREQLASHLMGFVAEVDENQLDEPQYESLAPGDQIGAAGLELQFDSVLRGRNGATRVQVDASGEPRGKPLSEIAPETGNSLVLTLDQELQQAGEAGLASFGKPGAFVAMSTEDGSILGMGSFPNFDPAVFTPPVSQRKYDALFNDEAKPLANRASQGQYPTGSTFKPVTALAALEEGTLTPTETIVDDGAFDLGDGNVLKNAGDAVYGPLPQQRALQVSSDIFFYTLGDRADTQTDEGIQNWATKLGLGPPTGLDLPYESAGLVPTPEWRNELYAQAADPDSCGGEARLFEPGCYETDRKWSTGDNVNLAIGQGDLLATPLQMAVAYATIGNGGDVVRPHLGDSVQDPFGRPVQDFTPAPRRSVDIDPAYRQVILDGLRDAAMEPTGTSFGVFGGFPYDIAGKTGTVERDGQLDQSWYVALAPYDNPKVVIAATVEGGGFGADTAAPIVRGILSAYFDVKPKDVKDVAGGAAGAAE